MKLRRKQEQDVEPVETTPEVDPGDATTPEVEPVETRPSGPLDVS